MARHPVGGNPGRAIVALLLQTRTSLAMLHARPDPYSCHERSIFCLINCRVSVDASMAVK